MKLFDRRVRLRLDKYVIEDLNIAFQVKKTLKPDPNTAGIKVWNMSEETRKYLESKERIDVTLEAGYAGEMLQLYFGQIRTVGSTYDGPDVVTEMATGDSEKEIAAARIHVPVGPKSNPGQVLELLVDSFGISRGNASLVGDALLARGRALFPRPTAFSGASARELQAFCHSAGLEWSIQDGKFQILEKGQSNQEKATILSAESGLIGSPKIDGKGKLECTALIQPGLNPGYRVVVSGRSIKGAFRVEETEYTGEAFKGPWYARITAQRYKVDA